MARMGEMRGAYRILVGKPEGRRLLGGSGRRWYDILKWIFKKSVGSVWNGLSWLRIGVCGWLL